MIYPLIGDRVYFTINPVILIVVELSHLVFWYFGHYPRINAFGMNALIDSKLKTLLTVIALYTVKDPN